MTNPHFLIIKAYNNSKVVDKLLEGCIEKLAEKEYTYEIVDIPTCFEIPAAIKMAIELDIYDSFIALGCVINSNSSCYEYLESIRGVNQIAIDYAAAIGCGIILAENLEQAITQADKTLQNKGGNSARTAIKMFELSRFFISKLDNYDQDLIDT